MFSVRDVRWGLSGGGVWVSATVVRTTPSATTSMGSAGVREDGEEISAQSHVRTEHLVLAASMKWVVSLERACNKCLLNKNFTELDAKKRMINLWICTILQCFCHNEATCNPVNGDCKCQPGFTGSRCEQYCPEGYWGDDCSEPCQCPGHNYVCDPVRG